jgi:hypothetical protein
MNIELQKFNSLVSLIQENGIKSETPPYVENATMVSYRFNNVNSEQMREYKSIAEGNTNEFEFYINVHTKSQSKKVFLDEFLASNSCRIINTQDGHGIDLIGEMFVLYKKVK